MKSYRKRVGEQGEAFVSGYLRQLGYAEVSRNYRCPMGELDLVFVRSETLVVVEVKSATGKRFGSPLERVGAVKRRRILRTTQHFLAVHPVYESLNVRFDVVAVARDPVSGVMTLLDHVESAFIPEN